MLLTRRQVFTTALGSVFQIPYYVTSLADSGPGTLREALKQGAKRVQFDVCGAVYLASPLYVTHRVYIDAEGANIALCTTKDCLAVYLEKGGYGSTFSHLHFEGV